jgi:Flp pilus assembly protein TadG
MLRIHSNQRSRRRSKTGNRRGTAAVEVVPCILLLLSLTFGTLEVCTGILLKQSLTIAAFEGVRAGVGRGTTEADIIEQTRKILEFRGVKWGDPANNYDSYDAIPDQDGDYGIFITTPNGAAVEDLEALEPITVRIVIASSSNATPIFKHLLDRKIDAQVVMVRSFSPPPPAS